MNPTQEQNNRITNTWGFPYAHGYSFCVDILYEASL
jgi:hypothetical protein